MTKEEYNHLLEQSRTGQKALLDAVKIGSHKNKAAQFTILWSTVQNKPKFLKELARAYIIALIEAARKK